MADVAYKTMAVEPRRLPIGYTLIGGVTVSLLMWAGIIWAGSAIYHLVR